MLLIMKMNRIGRGSVKTLKIDESVVIDVNIDVAVGESIVMLSAAKHLGTHVRCFAALSMTIVEVASLG